MCNPRTLHLKLVRRLFAVTQRLEIATTSSAIVMANADAVAIG